MIIQLHNETLEVHEEMDGLENWKEVFTVCQVTGQCVTSHHFRGCYTYCPSQLLSWIFPQQFPYH